MELTPEKVWKNCLSFIKDKKLIIHNADFDIGHLNNELEMVGKEKIDKKMISDNLFSPSKIDNSFRKFKKHIRSQSTMAMSFQ